MVTLLNDASTANETTHLFVGNETVWARIARLWAQERIGLDRVFVRCTQQGERVTDTQRQEELTRAHHEGKSNHRGENETLAALQRHYVWAAMGKTVHAVLAQCQVCQQAKYQRRPQHTPQELTPTASRPLERIQLDTFTWNRLHWVTIIDEYSKVAMAVPAARKSAEAVVEALLQWAQVFGTPTHVTSDSGREFDNSHTKELLRTWRTSAHISTPGRPQGHGVIERLHSTLTEHLRILEHTAPDGGTTNMQKAMVAYNHSVHATTGFTPFEVLFGVGCNVKPHPRAERETNFIFTHHAELTRTRERARAKMDSDKRRRTAKHRDQLTDVATPPTIGDLVYRRIPSNRRKLQALYDGPYRVITIREHNVVTLQDLQDPRRRRTCHVDQLKKP